MGAESPLLFFALRSRIFPESISMSAILPESRVRFAKILLSIKFVRELVLHGSDTTIG